MFCSRLGWLRIVIWFVCWFVCLIWIYCALISIHQCWWLIWPFKVFIESTILTRLAKWTSYLSTSLHSKVTYVSNEQSRTFPFDIPLSRMPQLDIYLSQTSSADRTLLLMQPFDTTVTQVIIIIWQNSVTFVRRFCCNRSSSKII